MGQSIYAFLLSQGAPPEVIQRIMNQMKGGSSLFNNSNPGMQGNLASKPPLSQPMGPRPLRRY